MILCIVSVAIKLALHFEKLPMLNNNNEPQAKEKLGSEGIFTDESLCSLHRLKRPEDAQGDLLALSLQTIQLEKSVKILKLFKIKRANEAQISWLSLDD